jgi:hypothetical protein
MQHGVGNRLAHGHVDSESSIVTDAGAADELSDRAGRGGNRFDSAG